MPRVQEVIPEVVAAEAEAARAFFSQTKGGEFKLTGIVDPPETAAGGDPRELQLILCGQEQGQDVCLRERFRVAPGGSGFDVTHLEEPPLAIGSPAPLLDPPAGERKGWLEGALSRHTFAVFLFYRGFW